MVKAQANARKVDKADAVVVNTDPGPTEEVVKSMPGSEYPSPNPPVAPDSPEADPTPEPDVKDPTPADNPSPGRNAVPVNAPASTYHSFDQKNEETGLPEGYTKDDLVPGTNVPQPSAPKSGSMTR